MSTVTESIPVHAKLTGLVDCTPDDGEFIPAHALITQVFPSGYDGDEPPDRDHTVNIGGRWRPNIDEGTLVDHGDLLGWIIPAPDATPEPAKRRGRGWLDEPWAKRQRRFRGACNYAAGVVKAAEADLATLDRERGRHTGFAAVIRGRRDWGRAIADDLSRASRAMFRAQASAMRSTSPSAVDEKAHNRQLDRAFDLRKRIRNLRARALRHANAGGRRGNMRGATRRSVIEALNGSEK